MLNRQRPLFPLPEALARFLLLFSLCLAFLGYRYHLPSFAAGYVDPIGRIAAQDEALYAHSAKAMAEGGDWLTPVFMDRPALYKPPLLYWLSAALARIGGFSTATARFPSLLISAAALAALGVFLWRRLGAAAALAALLLAAANPLFHFLSRAMLGDALLTGLFVFSATLLARQPRLEGRAAWLYGFLAGLAILTKSVAGLLPLFVLAATLPGWKALTRAAASAFLAAAPWHLYQLTVNSRWFLAEYIGVELFDYAAGSPAQTSPESAPVFYASRYFQLDPMLALLGLAAVAVCLMRRAPDSSRVPLLWTAVLAAAVLAYQYHNIAYWCPLAAFLAWLAVEQFPWLARPAVLAALCLLVAARIALPDEHAGLKFHRVRAVPEARLLADYAARHRPNELLKEGLEDELSASLLALPRLRYLFFDGGAPGGSLDFRKLGIALSTAEFLDLPNTMPLWSGRLAAFGLPTPRPIGTAIYYRGAADIEKLVLGCPRSDFLLPARLTPENHPHHARQHVSGGRALLLARGTGR